LAADSATRRTFLILLEEPHAWVAAATLARLSPPGTVETLISPVPGAAFLSATGPQAAELDEWWERMATATGRPVVLAAHEEDLPGWIPGLDADFVVAVPDQVSQNSYAHLSNVITTVDDDPRQLAELALRGPASRAQASAPQVRSVPLAPRLDRPVPPAVSAALPPPPAPVPPPPALPPTAPPPVAPAARQPFEPAAAAGRSAALDPFELLSRAEPVEPAGPAGPQPTTLLPQNPYGRDAPTVSRRTLLGEDGRAATAVDQRTRPAVAATRSAMDPRQILDRLGQGRRAPVSAELGQAVLACKPLVAAVVSRKGGVGKTASAAAVAAILGEAVDPFGHTAALVDANVGNPDAWGRLDVRGDPPTMREIVRSLMAGLEPPGPAFAETPALAVYPESREAGEGYAPAQIQRVAGYLKGRHAAVVVDLPNRLPAFTSAEAAVAAAWIAEADVLVLPTTADPTALLGAIEYLDADTVQGKPVVVSYIVPRVRQIRDAPQVRGMLDRIRASVAALVEVPDDDRATLALVRRVAITEVSGELRNAYLNLATRVIEAAASRNGGWS
jgi:MinD-like ATPase involved in chromosome partitioning or flagellar assembly